jgi:hypothetical protein
MAAPIAGDALPAAYLVNAGPVAERGASAAATGPSPEWRYVGQDNQRGDRVPEDSPPPVNPEPPAGPDADLGRGDISPADGTGLTDTIVGHFADQARRTANAARSGRLVNADGEPGVLDLTPWRELAAELVEELQKVRLRDRIARALRQAADIIDSQTPGH